MLSNRKQLCLQVGKERGLLKTFFLQLFHSFKGEGIMKSKET